jgi:predicted dehydrogenase
MNAMLARQTLRAGMAGMGMIFDETYRPFFERVHREPLFDNRVGAVNVPLVAVASLTGARAEAYRKQSVNKIAPFQSFSGENAVDLMIQAGIDFACVATPDNQHFAIAKRLLESGIHVLIEKPSVLRLCELQELVDLASRRGLLAKVVYHKLLDPDHKKLRTLVVDQVLKHVNHGYCSLLEPKQISGSQFAAWITGRNPGTYVAVHYIKLIDFTFGGVLKTVTATGQRGLVGPKDGPTWDSTQLRLIYEYDDDVGESDGPRRLHPSTYHARLTQRLITALTVPTRRGKLYEVDLRLRPSGGKGPVATRLGAFRDYQMREAETWEHMALTRARVVAGDAPLARDTERAIADILCAARDPEKTRRDALAMRRLIAREKGDNDPWDLKLVAGGMMDIEFIAQYMALRHAHARPDILDVAPMTILERARELGLMTATQVETLRGAHNLFTTVTQITRIAINGAFRPADVAPGVLRRMATATGLPDFRTLEASLLASRRGVRGVFETIFS